VAIVGTMGAIIGKSSSFPSVSMPGIVGIKVLGITVAVMVGDLGVVGVCIGDGGIIPVSILFSPIASCICIHSIASPKLKLAGSSRLYFILAISCNSCNDL